jgi:hypothetical protein
MPILRRTRRLTRSAIALLRDLATKVLDGTVVLSPRRLSGQVTKRSPPVAVRGIGPGTAEPD